MGLSVRLRRVKFPHLDLAGTSWEDDKLGLVGLQPLDIGLKTFKWAVLTAVIHWDANGWGKLLGDPSCLCAIGLLRSESWSKDNTCKFQRHYGIKATMLLFKQAIWFTFSSSRVKPLPALDFMLYLSVWHWTMGRSGPEVGRGKIFTAFFCLAAKANTKRKLDAG